MARVTIDLARGDGRVGVEDDHSEQHNFHRHGGIVCMLVKATFFGPTAQQWPYLAWWPKIRPKFLTSSDD